MRILDYLLFPFAVAGAVLLSLPVLIPYVIGWALDTLAYGSYYGPERR